MDNIKNSKILKIVSYVLIPILVLMIGVTIFHQVYVYENKEELDKGDYLKTEVFANHYYNELMTKIYRIQYGDTEEFLDNYYNLIQDKNQKIYFERYHYYNSGNIVEEALEYLILNRETNTIYTNIKVEDGNYQNIIQRIKQQEPYWNMVNGKIETTMDDITENNLKYENGTQYIEELKNKNFDIYTAVNRLKLEQNNKTNLQMQTYNKILKTQKLPGYLLPISILLLIMIVIYLLVSIGHEKGKKGITLKRVDRISYEILLAIVITILTTFIAIFIESTRITGMLGLISFLVCYSICYVALAILTVSTIKRIKAKEFWKSFLCYKILKWFQEKFREIKGEILEKTNEVRKIVIYYTAFIGISTILILLAQNSFFMFLLLMTFWTIILYKMIQYQKKLNHIKQTLKSIYEGNNKISLNKEELTGILKEMANYMEDIAGGFSNAIEESLKSERLKTELITNVSHDIKTPLTSIINYVDLLKKEELTDPKIKEYIEILDSKSQRLKKLIEDLVEASKVSSGNVKLNIERIDLKELLNQTIGEFEDRFSEKGLQIEKELPEEVKIQADNRYMYRIIENLFSNITKYAMENSRVYIKLENTGYQIRLEIKNISKEKLNIEADELMQRFVRGDKSRYTEGSGLGLSIAQSLTELQKGKFNIKIDGDLFKVEMIWDAEER